MLFDSCQAHTFKSSHMRLCVLFFQMVTNLILFIGSFPETSLSKFAGLFYCCSLLITVFASLTVVNMWGGGGIKDFVAMNKIFVTMT